MNENLSTSTQNLKPEKPAAQDHSQGPMRNDIPDSNQNGMPNSVPKKKAPEKYPWTFRRVAAWAAIVLLLFLYVLTFISALLSRPGAGRLFQFCVGMTIVVPVFAWFLIWASGKLRK